MLETKRASSGTTPGVAAEIVAMDAADQEMRTAALKGEGPWLPELDRMHTERMRAIVEELGWPTISKVGEAASMNAWRLVQHADHDVAFQEHCLGLMKACPPGEVLKEKLAYLEDRIRVNRGQPQPYGTQGYLTDQGDWVTRPIEDRRNVNSRRAAVGLEPIEQYILYMNREYGTNR
jgi:hypothetical protein